MFFPEGLYVLSDRDQQVTWLDPRFARDTDAQVATDTAAQINPSRPGAVFLFQSATVEAVPGAAQAPTRLAIVIRPAAGGLNDRIELAISIHPIVANQRAALNWSGSLLLPPDWLIEGLATFNAGGVSNNCVMGVHGMLIPVANIQRV